MPTYDYECPDGHRFELFQKMSDDPVAMCPECGKKAKRMISGGAGFLFKGEGFYTTDYRSEDYKKKASAEPGASTTSTGSKGSGEGSGSAGGASTGSDGGSGDASKGSGEGSSGSTSSSKTSDSE